jgi:hypothetical protein
LRIAVAALEKKPVRLDRDVARFIADALRRSH